MEQIETGQKEEKGLRLIVVSSIKPTVEKLSEGKITSVSEDLPKALNEKVREMLLDGIRRAKDNNRKTLLARDL